MSFFMNNTPTLASPMPSTSSKKMSSSLSVTISLMPFSFLAASFCLRALTGSLQQGGGEGRGEGRGGQRQAVVSSVYGPFKVCCRSGGARGRGGVVRGRGRGGEGGRLAGWLAGWSTALCTEIRLSTSRSPAPTTRSDRGAGAGTHRALRILAVFILSIPSACACGSPSAFCSSIFSR